MGAYTVLKHASFLMLQAWLWFPDLNCFAFLKSQNITPELWQKVVQRGEMTVHKACVMSLFTFVYALFSPNERYCQDVQA